MLPLTAVKKIRTIEQYVKELETTSQTINSVSLKQQTNFIFLLQSYSGSGHMPKYTSANTRHTECPRLFSPYLSGFSESQQFIPPGWQTSERILFFTPIICTATDAAHVRKRGSSFRKWCRIQTIAELWFVLNSKHFVGFFERQSHLQIMSMTSPVT